MYLFGINELKQNKIKFLWIRVTKGRYKDLALIHKESCPPQGRIFFKSVWDFEHSWKL